MAGLSWLLLVSNCERTGPKREQRSFCCGGCPGGLGGLGEDLAVEIEDFDLVSVDVVLSWPCKGAIVRED